MYALDDTLCLKVYKSLVTSDGLSTTEIGILESVGEHPNLISGVGRVKCVEGEGVLMKRIGREFKSLGCPPNFDTITRDVFVNRFEVGNVLMVLKGIASALVYLHSRSVCHGDLYAHNIMYSQDHVYLTDFGAAFSYKGLSSILSFQIEKIEVRAFGCLIDDLFVRCDGDERVLKSLGELRDACILGNVQDRPSFTEIFKTLNSIK